MIPDSAVAIDKKREAQPFRSEVDGFLPLSRHRSAVHRGDIESHSNDVRKRKMTLKLHSRTPSLLQDSTSLPATAESGMMTNVARSKVKIKKDYGRVMSMMESTPHRQTR